METPEPGSARPLFVPPMVVPVAASNSFWIPAGRPGILIGGGVYEGDSLKYAGQVGSGFDENTLRQLYEMKPAERKSDG